MSDRRSRKSESEKDTKNSSDIYFADGMIVKEPHRRAPSFVQLELSIKVEDFIKTLKEHVHKEWVNIVVKESKGGKLYAEVSTWAKDNDL